jgi:hypothetical protein
LDVNESRKEKNQGSRDALTQISCGIQNGGSKSKYSEKTGNNIYEQNDDKK